MENKKCENCKQWSVVTEPSIGKCRKRNATTIFNDICSQFEVNEVPDYINDMFNDIFDNMKVEVTR